MRQFIQDLTTQMRGIWARLEGPQRLVVAAVLLATFVGLGGIVWFAGQPSYEVVFSATSGEETARVQQALQKAGLSWQLDDSGMRVLVERNKVGQAKSAIAGEGLIGANVVLVSAAPQQGTVTDLDGRFARRMKPIQGDFARGARRSGTTGPPPKPSPSPPWMMR